MTGLIYVGIIAVWAMVLVPAWLRRHDHRDPERSVNRFTRSLEELSRRDSVLGIKVAPVAEEPAVVQPDEVAPEVHRVERSQSSARPTATEGRSFRPGPRRNSPTRGLRSAVRPAAARRSAARRRVVLGVLFAVLLVVVGLVVAGVLLPISLAAPVGLLVTFLVVARVQVRRSQQHRASATGYRVARQPVVERAQSHLDSGRSASTWEARPATLPTYVTAPRAAEFPRVIDTETPGAWTAAAMLERAQQQKDRSERMAAARAEAIARAQQAEQAAAEARTRDEEFLDRQASAWEAQNTSAPTYQPRVVNE